jgi:hypothetical protein
MPGEMKQQYPGYVPGTRPAAEAVDLPKPFRLQVYLVKKSIFQQR